MPRVPKEQVTPDQLYGLKKVESNLTMGMRIHKRFRPTDTVKVRNITNQSLTWQWFDEQDERYTIEDDTNIKIVDRDEPGLWQLGPGEDDILIGACAYLMIEALYKQVCVMKTGIVINPQSEREIRNFSIDDPERQDQFIDMVFIGKLSPQDMQKAALASLAEDDGRKHILEILPELATEQTEHAARARAAEALRTPRTETAPHKDLSELADEFDAGSTLLGTATGGLPADRQAPAAAPVPAAPPVEPEEKPGGEEKPEPKPAAPKANAKAEKKEAAPVA